MSWRFFRRIRVFQHVWLNFSKSGASISVGVRGLRATFGRRTTRLTAGIPGSGLSATHLVKRKDRPSDDGVGHQLLEKALGKRGTSD